MNLPTIPTDNLYKFLSIAGIVLFVASVISITVIQKESSDALFSYNSQVLATEKKILNAEEEIGVTTGREPSRYTR